MTRVTKTESGEQQAVMDWAYVHSGFRPELTLLFHVPNGGLRSKATAARLKREGVKEGVSDLCLPVSRKALAYMIDGATPKEVYTHCGLWIEMKVGRNKTTPEQERWIMNMTRQGWACVVCWSFEEAVAAIINYLSLPSLPVEVEVEP